MKLRFLAALLFVCSSAHAQLPPEKALSQLSVTNPALEISLWASEPLFSNPTCIDIDHKGRVWVCESVNYRDTLLGRPLRRSAGDRILILEDSKRTGKADKVTVFYQSPQILAPLGIAVAKDPVGPGYKVYVCQSPDILVFEDKDGDGKADGPPKKLISGFRGIDHDHGVHGILIGPDGKLYFSVGDEGVAGLRGKGGKKTWTSNETDCTAGTIWRCDLDGRNLELIAHNFRNEYEPCVDSFGTVFVSDNDDDGSEQTRICYVMSGGNYGYHPRGPGQSHWHEEQPGVVPKILRTWFGSPTGMCVYEGTLLPRKYRGQLLHTDAGPRHLRCYHLTADGAGYAVDREDMVTGKDDWFRPSDVCVAPDGSAYVADWYDPGVGGHNMGDVRRGRIYRVAPKGNKPSVPKVDLDSKEGLTAALASPALSVRYMVMRQLWRMKPAAASAVLEAAATQKDNVWLRARALWQLARRGARGRKYVQAAFADPDPRFRVLAIRLAEDYFNKSPADYSAEAARAIINDPSAAVRREALLALRDVDPGKAKPLIVKLAKRYAGKDRFYLEAVGIAVGREPGRRQVILADFDQEFPAWSDAMADLVWELHPPQMLSVLAERLADPKLPVSQRRRIVEVLLSYTEISAGKSLLKALSSDIPQDLRESIIDRLKLSLSGKWRALRHGPELTATIDRLLAKPKTRLTGLAVIAAAQKEDAAGNVAAVAEDVKETPAIRGAAIETLGVLHSARALKSLQQLVVGESQTLAIRQMAVAAVAGSRPGSSWLLELQQKKVLPAPLKPDVGRALRSSPYEDLRKRAFAAFPPPGRLDPAKLPSIAELARRRGSPAHGKQVMATNKDLRCLACHTIRGAGGHVGPDLSMVGKKASRENLFESILFPSKAIANEYLSWVIGTKDGLVLTGLIVEETADHVTLRDANGKDTKIAREQIDSKSKSPNSLMPNDLLAYMAEDDLVDIVSYLYTLRTASLSMDYWHHCGPYDNGQNDVGLDIVFPPEKRIDLKATHQGKSGPVGWLRVKPDEKGYVDLRAFLGKDSPNSVSYVYREIESPADQEARVLLGTDGASKLWVNGREVYNNRQHRPALPEAASVAVSLKKGRNRLLLKLSNGDGPDGFYFTIEADLELKTRQWREGDLAQEVSRKDAKAAKEERKEPRIGFFLCVLFALFASLRGTPDKFIDRIGNLSHVSVAFARRVLSRPVPPSPY